jgi:glutaredoxin
MKDEFYTVIIKKNCPYSINAIELLKNKNKKYKEIDYYKLNTKLQNEIVDTIKEINNNKEYKLFPKIFKNDKFIGGYDDLSKMI